MKHRNGSGPVGPETGSGVSMEVGENAVRAEKGGSKCGWVGNGDPFRQSPG